MSFKSFMSKVKTQLIMAEAVLECGTHPALLKLVTSCIVDNKHTEHKVTVLEQRVADIETLLQK